MAIDTPAALSSGTVGFSDREEVYNENKASRVQTRIFWFALTDINNPEIIVLQGVNTKHTQIMESKLQCTPNVLFNSVTYVLNVIVETMCD